MIDGAVSVTGGLNLLPVWKPEIGRDVRVEQLSRVGYATAWFRWMFFHVCVDVTWWAVDKRERREEG